MKRKHGLTVVDRSVDSNYFKHLANLLYYKRVFDSWSEIEDTEKFISFETIREICAKHFELPEECLSDRKLTKYSRQQELFMGVLWFYSVMDSLALAKKLKRHTRTIDSSSRFLSHYLDLSDPDYNLGNFRLPVHKIILECEEKSGGRVTANVEPQLRINERYPVNGLKFTDVRKKSIFTPDEISTVPIKNIEFFRENGSFHLTAVSQSGQVQTQIEYSTYEHVTYLHLMQSFGYRFLAWYEFSALCMESAAKINARTVESLKSYIYGKTDSDKCTGCIHKAMNSCPVTVQKSGFCPKLKGNIPSLDKDGDRMNVVYTNDLSQMDLFTCWAQ
jgi:hypothetical protein